MGAQGRLQWVGELVGGTEVEMASGDEFLKKLSCEEERGTVIARGRCGGR